MELRIHMVTYNLEHPRLSSYQGLLFDMDLTLYRHDDYYSSQLKNQVILLARERGESVDDLQNQLDAWANEFSESHQGKKPSFGNTLLGALGIPIAQSVELRRRAIRPEDFLQADAHLDRTLAALGARFRLVLVTNNPSDIAQRTLDVLGVRQHFPRIIGLDDSGHSKPHPSAFQLALASLHLEATQCVSIGDRYPVDLEWPVSQGAGGVLVESMEDVYALPDLFGLTE